MWRPLNHNIQVKLNKCKIDKNNCVAQTYDGANVMRVPHAFYIHCHKHRLNLVLVDVVKNVDEIYIILYLDLQFILSLLSFKNKFLKFQNQLNLKDYALLVGHLKFIHIDYLEVILLLLYSISNEKSIRSSEATGLLKNTDFKFIYLLLFFNDLLSQINLLTKYLQDKNDDIAKAIILMNSLKEHFCEIRNDLSYHLKLYIEGNSLESSVLNSETDFRNNLYLIIIDKINAELNKRFSNNEDLLMGISVLNPSNSNFLDKKLIHPFVLSYMCDIDTLDSELNIIRKSLKQFESKYHSIKTIFQFHKFLLDYQLAFFELYKLCTIAITIPVSSVACERNFSYMKRIKSYLRNSMLHNNLSNLSIIAIEKSETKLLNIDDIINNFAECHNNRRIILK
ncbi:hypothetical protein AGLY_016945 [Aphis glycines]|uniref:HAT C-terminal dimerisation domain-containing protein n=1 Tax=Aphis glycines TaxID=307491 RepID=A0A6G0SWN4_APHGL|nr:hypothetical protein AGLY_016945 [Aphis glycines]